MISRRSFLQRMCNWLPAGMLAAPFCVFLSKGFAAAERTLLKAGTPLASLIHRNPRDLDTRNLALEKLADFQTMGLTDYTFDMHRWRLEVVGRVARPLKIGYEELMSLPPVERKVLMICPGVFANYGRWKGISVGDLLRRSRASHRVTHVDFSGPPGPYAKTERFAADEIRSGRVFLAYAVNGTSLPRKHGYPLRVVAADHYGFQWVKYVERIACQVIDAQ